MTGGCRRLPGLGLVIGCSGSHVLALIRWHSNFPTSGVCSCLFYLLVIINSSFIFHSKESSSDRRSVCKLAVGLPLVAGAAGVPVLFSKPYDGLEYYGSCFSSAAPRNPK